MLTKLKKHNSEGFTIIEVMIVLAIAGLILLIVFLAVPALQRNSRNTQRKNDVASLLASVSEYANNNNGTLPAACSGTNPVQFGAASGGSQAKIGYYTTTACAAGTSSTAVQGGVYMKTTTGNVGPFNGASQDGVVIVKGDDCGPTAGQAVPGSARSIAAVYEIESGAGTYSPQCQAS